ncbi:hypothetical protein B5G43_12215 [Flavonifractor sp. An92]|uniref:S-layer homology domain-containing protein n=1 Tax=Flavonifractor sp. An92 TaxID=1965666 RepID=UPI000B57B754|nr:S-layer homology domain-containing protein [Flavonifractor sp. An92]OUN05669.1 hypothetical protein B5G43_12215 [Flavonifractor sp. An92]
MKVWKKGIFLVLTLGMTGGMFLTGTAQALDVPVDSSTFPDPAFLSYVQKRDTDGDGLLSQSERDAVTQMDLRKLGIQDLSGLEWFSALESLNCSENDLVSLELADFPALTSLTCNENTRLTELTLSGVPALEQLHCFDSGLSQLDLHGVPNLTYFVWGGSPLEELDLSGNPNLHTLHVLGGNLTHADLSHNEKLDTLLWNHTWIETLDLSHQTELTYLNCTDNHLTALDLSGNEKLETVYAGNNRLLAIRLPQDSVSFCDLSGQRPVPVSLTQGENTVSLTDLVPWMDPGQVSAVSGGTLEGDRIRLDAPNQSITYRYTDGAATLDAALEVTGENGWLVPLHLENWTYGENPATPQAQPTFGTAVFSYGASPQGPFQPEPPTTAGTWYVRATVEGTDQYEGLEAVAPFRIEPAVPEYQPPEVKYATYGDFLAEIALEPQFSWEDGELRVGNVGTQTHLARYTPLDLIDYQVVEHIPVQIEVAPYDGTRLPIPPIGSREEAENLVIRHGDWVLQKGVDYETTLEDQGENVQVTIRFQGNYTGTVLRTFDRETGTGGGSTANTFWISAQATAGGSMTPSGKLRVMEGDTPSFTITPREGYRLQDVLVDGRSVGAVTTYRFAPVTASHTISARFVPLNSGPSPEETGVADLLETQSHHAYVFGYPDGRFGPDDPMTRAQAAQIFYSLLKDKDVPIAAGFSDVTADAWYARAVNTLASLGKVAGVGEGKFLPDRPITRAEFVTMAMGFARPASGAACAFPDVGPEDWFYDAVMGAAEYGWISGCPDGSFAPQRLVTRGEAVSILNRMLDRRADRAFLDEHADVRRFPDVPASHWAFDAICEGANSHDYQRTDGGEVWEGLL